MSSKDYQKEYSQRDEVKERKRLYNEANKERLREKNRQYNKEWKAKNKHRLATYKSRTSEYKRASRLKSNYGLTVDQWNDIFESQDKRCAICRSDSCGSKNNNWHTDHCHKTGKVRGILCHFCNLVLGQAKDSTLILEQAILYLNRNA